MAGPKWFHIDVCEKCRRIRLVLMVLLIAFAALAGYHWGSILESRNYNVENHDVLLLAVMFTVLVVVVALAVEAAVTRTEIEAATAQASEVEKVEESSISRAQANELNRIVDRLSEDNSDLRYKLLSKKMHEMTEDIMGSTRSDAASRHAWRSNA